MDGRTCCLTDRDVESITMLAGWNAIDAEHQGNTVRRLYPCHF
jgi:hypothetical protein